MAETVTGDLSYQRIHLLCMRLRVYMTLGDSMDYFLYESAHRCRCLCVCQFWSTNRELNQSPSLESLITRAQHSRVHLSRFPMTQNMSSLPACSIFMHLRHCLNWLNSKQRFFCMVILSQGFAVSCCTEALFRHLSLLQIAQYVCRECHRRRRSYSA